MAKDRRGNGFTMVELLLALAIVAVIAIVAVYVLRPQELFKQSNDTNRVQGLSAIDKAITLYYTDALNNPGTLFMGTSSIYYLSLPDPTATTTAGTNCAALGFIATGTITYHCAASSTYLKADGTGWIPIKFNSYSAGSPMATLPRDPLNTSSSGEYFVYVTDGIGGYEIYGQPQSAKYASNTADFQKGTNLTLLTSWPPGSGGGGGGGGGMGSGNIFVVDNGNNRVEVFSSAGAYITQFGQAGSGSGQLNYPVGIAVDKNGIVWVVDSYNARVAGYSQSGNTYNFYDQFGYYGGGNGGFGSVDQITFDATGTAWVTDPGYARIQAFTPSGTTYAYSQKYGTYGTGNGLFGNNVGPDGVAVDSYGNLWLSDPNVNSSTCRIEEFSPSGSSYVYAGQFGSCGNGNGQLGGYADRLLFDKNKNMLVVDVYNQRIEIFAPSGTTYRYLNQFGSSGSGNGQFASPWGAAFDSNGNLWVTDSSNNRVQEFAPSGTTYSYVTQFGSAGSGNGQFNFPNVITIY